MDDLLAKSDSYEINLVENNYKIEYKPVSYY
jgi:hypothetical protein